MGEATVHDPGEPVVPPAIDFNQLTVDIEAMEDFIRLIQAEIDQNLEPYSNEIINDHWSGEAIASHTASVPLSGFRQAYYVAVGAAIDGLKSYLHETRVLQLAVQLLAQKYRGADVMATAKMEDVNGAMSFADTQLRTEAAASPVTPV